MASLIASAIAGTADAAHAAAASLSATKQIKPGDTVPTSRQLKENAPDDFITISDLSGKNIILGVPGAFTPSCNSQVPGYIEKYDEFRARGVNNIFVVAVNDAFVVKAWKEKLTNGAGSPVRFLADDKGGFIGELGLLFDASPVFGGPRSKRFVLIIDNGKATHLAVEQNPAVVTITSADTIITQL